MGCGFSRYDSCSGSWNGSWNGRPRNPSAISAIAAVRCSIRAGQATSAGEQAPRKASAAPRTVSRNAVALVPARVPVVSGPPVWHQSWPAMTDNSSALRAISAMARVIGAANWLVGDRMQNMILPTTSGSSMIVASCRRMSLGTGHDHDLCLTRPGVTGPGAGAGANARGGTRRAD
jgi:hypothetical protein